MKGGVCGWYGIGTSHREDPWSHTVQSVLARLVSRPALSPGIPGQVVAKEILCPGLAGGHLVL